MTKTRTITCGACAEPFEHVPSGKGGRPPKFCPTHRRPSGPPENRDHDGNRDRKNARRRAVREGEAIVAEAQETFAVARLAAAMSMFEDPESAAQFIGETARGEELERLMALARERHAAVLDQDPQAFRTRAMALGHLMLLDLAAQRHQISPRDMPHAMRALAQVSSLFGGDEAPRFADIRIVMPGDGAPHGSTD